ncbi:MAG: sulfatase family protein [Opitutales bacterium]
MKKHLFKKISALAALTMSLQAADQPNVILFLVDDLGYKDIGCYGGPVKTPTLDSLAANGVRFEEFYAGAAVCSPSRATMLTGRHHIRTGVYSWIHDVRQKSHLLKREITIAEVLKDAGYATGHFGKWHLGLPYFTHDKPTPADHGFDYWFATANNAEPSHHNPENFYRNGEALGVMEGYACQIVTDEAIQWLDDRESKKEPFFLNIWYHEPHQRIAAPQEIVDIYKTDMPHDPKAKPKKGKKANRAIYSATIDNTDRAIARLIAKLEAEGELENTLIIYTSDNGSYVGDRVGDLRGVKGENWEGGIRVPGIYTWPGKIPAGRVIQGPSGIVDVLPTICGLLGIDPPTENVLDGEDISSILTSSETEFERETVMYWHLQKSRPMVVIRDGNYNLVAQPDFEMSTKNMFDEAWIPTLREGSYTGFQLFDLAKDPNQTTDIAAQHPEIVETLKAKLVKKNASVMAEGPDWNVLEPNTL